MKLGVCMQALAHLPLAEGLAWAGDHGIQAVELAVHPGNPWLDVPQALADHDDGLGRAVARAGLSISALGVHQAGQLLLGPHGEETDGVFAGTAAEKAAFAAGAMVDAAELARRLGVPTVCGFIGCEAWARWFPWPLADGWARMGPTARERLLPVLDAFAARGVRFAHECHPNQLAYDLETALGLVELVDGHPALAFNLDPANLLIAGVDPVAFVAELGDRVVHVHAKDAERVKHNAHRSGPMAQGPWGRRDRGFRFRVPGWGDVDWRALISELQLAGYTDGVLSIEHEDPAMSRREGLLQAVRHLEPLLLHEPPEPRWW